MPCLWCKNGVAGPNHRYQNSAVAGYSLARSASHHVKVPACHGQPDATAPPPSAPPASRYSYYGRYALDAGPQKLWSLKALISNLPALKKVGSVMVFDSNIRMSPGPASRRFALARCFRWSTIQLVQHLHHRQGLGARDPIINLLAVAPGVHHLLLA